MRSLPSKKPRFTVSRETTLKAQRLRREATPFERMIWAKINRKQIGYAFRRQHSVGPYILDFYCSELSLAFEIDGYSHGIEGGPERDARRTAYLAERGIRVVRFWNDEVREDLVSVVERIIRACDEPAAEQGE